MAIPYIPGAWDMLKGSAVPFTNDLLRTVAPQVFGRYDMQQMLKQNPMLAGQLAGMEGGQRDAFAQAFGLQNAANSPIANIGTTAALRRDQTNEEILSQGLAADPAGVLDRMTGARTPQGIAIENEKVIQAPLQTQNLQQGLEQGKQQLAQGEQILELNKYKIQDAARASQEIEKMFAAYPTLQGINVADIARASVRGDPVDPLLMGRISNDPGAANLYKAYEQTLRDQMTEGFIRGRISIQAGTRDSNIMAQTLNQGSIAANQEVLRAMQAVQDFRKENPMLFIQDTDKFTERASPELVNRYNELKNQVKIANSNVSVYNNARAKLLDLEGYNEGQPTGEAAQFNEAAISKAQALINAGRIAKDQIDGIVQLSPEDKAELRRRIGG